jgi:hypothetical protein
MMQLSCPSCTAPLGEPMPIPSINVKSGLSILGGLIVLAGILAIANWSSAPKRARRPYN